ncbi:hypothetical protein D7Y24_02285 [Stenotrophomonas maltophilia]|uniref:hypothetical protein n=1 Tax=Stenotrophomonas maltophilia TaxID=40324 RepID=UPI0015E0169C|nr:hypothetical protein [Stenotrophomonas maltophilia]ELN2583156.1 hypothetical protein [Stenotrophomonas maltophilia]ELN2591406.1 hypothetical protein [Stenotrophomonas maltophilia]MBA0297256.1 hypothetical protein [Stenotrophomonas maltophilia]MBH1399359.1 hypothetical protein [Stenotrophomonas maltophilia]MBH1701664.1 hypothetical protein [Stenotrophomonas maltophilia]
MSNTVSDAEREQEREKATGEALRVTFERIKTLPPTQVIQYLTSVALVGIELLRANGREDAYVREFLEGALTALDAPPIFTLKDLRTHQ